MLVVKNFLLFFAICKQKIEKNLCLIYVINMRFQVKNIEYGEREVFYNFSM